jgi:DNA-binding beta-propeller fold protein YncE
MPGLILLSFLSVCFTSSCAASSSHGVAPAPTPTPTDAVAALSPPPCTTAVAPEVQLADTEVGFESLPAPPFGVAVSPIGAWSFVAETDEIAVMSDRTSLPTQVRMVKLPDGIAAEGLGITSDGRYLLAASGSGAVVLAVGAAEVRSEEPVLGILSTHLPRVVDATAIEVIASPDNGYVFVSLEYADAIAVYNLRAALATGFHDAGFVGLIPVGESVVGMAISPNGQWLYATSERAAGMLGVGSGTLSVIDLERAETAPSLSVVATVDAGCSPVRVVVSSDGGVVWVTARGSDALLAFSAHLLVTDPTRALIAHVQVGEAPVGLVLIDSDQFVVVADSNRFRASGASAELSVISTVGALTGRPAVVGAIRADAFPRELAVEPGGETLLATNYGSDQLEVVAFAPKLTTSPG